MSRKPLSYADAVKLLGGQSPVLEALGKLVGVGGLAAAPAGGVGLALNLFGLRDEAVSLGQSAIVWLRKRVTGLNRFSRSELIEAAHVVLVISSFFAALDDLDADLGTTLNTASLELTRHEQTELVVGRPGPSGRYGLAELARELITPGKLPGLDSDESLPSFYAGLSRRLHYFTARTSAWDERSETQRVRWARSLDQLPNLAERKYEEQLTRLASEFPEFAFWAQRVGLRHVLDHVLGAERGITELTELVAARGREADEVRSDLVARYRTQVSKPIADTSAVDGVRLPPLNELYVNACFRELSPQQAAAGGDADAEPMSDLWARVLEHLITTAATRAPLVLLGQPGAGKSAFTQMLAAELDPRDYLVVRVELRAVPADSDIQTQIETAIAGLTGRTMSWPDLAKSSADAQLLVILDGFDELLQASGISHFNFLERVQEFQEREADLGRPVAALVTSRTAVANQVRYPDWTRVAKLEEFNDAQVGQWLDVWNQYNPERPFTAEEALTQGDLARQPLLLFLLALFRSSGGELTEGASQAHLFQRLFTSFVMRDIDKLDARLSDRDRQRAVRRDLDELSMVAFAMFNRGRQSVTDTELLTDLAALQHDHFLTTSPLTIAQRLAGRFFFRLFVHRDQATRGQQEVLNSYEFLHASFGEFLVARWVVSEMLVLDDQARRAADDPYPQPPDDTRLRALLSVTVLSTREGRVLEFIRDLLSAAPEELAALRTLLLTLYRGSLQPPRSDPHPQYHPVLRNALAGYAAYSANLVLLTLATMGTDDSLSTKELRTSPDSGSFHAVAGLWQAQLTQREWDSLLTGLDFVPPASVRLLSAPQAERLVSASDLLGFPAGTLLGNADRVPSGSWIDTYIREAALLGLNGYGLPYRTLLPYWSALGCRYGTSNEDPQVMTVLLPEPITTPGVRTKLYKELFAGDFSNNIMQARVLLGRFRDDLPHLAPLDICSITIAAFRYAWTNITAYLDVLARLGELADSSQFSTSDLDLDAIEPLTLVMTGMVIDRSYMPDASGLVQALDLNVADLNSLPDKFIAPDWYDRLILFDPDNFLGADGSHGVINELFREETDTVVCAYLVGIRDMLGIRDPRDLLRLIKPREPDKLFDLALWTSKAERGLTPEQLPGIDDEAFRLLEQVAPGFVTKTRRLAAENGHADPFRGPSYP